MRAFGGFGVSLRRPVCLCSELRSDHVDLDSTYLSVLNKTRVSCVSSLDSMRRGRGGERGGTRKSGHQDMHAWIASTLTTSLRYISSYHPACLGLTTSGYLQPPRSMPVSSKLSNAAAEGSCAMGKRQGKPPCYSQCAKISAGLWT